MLEFWGVGGAFGFLSIMDELKFRICFLVPIFDVESENRTIHLHSLKYPGDVLSTKVMAIEVSGMRVG